VSLLEALKGMSAHHIQLLLSLLGSWVEKYWELSERDVQAAVGHQRVPSFSQVLDWLQCLVDAQFTHMVPNCSLEIVSAIEEFLLVGDPILSLSHFSRCTSLQTFILKLTSSSHWWAPNIFLSACSWLPYEDY
jgi:hypothetical protein